MEELTEGSKVGPFTIVNAIGDSDSAGPSANPGEGAFGKVYRAKDPAGKLVAIKAIREVDGGDAIQEAKRLKKALPHPNVANILLVIDKKYLAMELVEGRTLEHVLEHDGRFESDAWWPYLSGLLEGTAYLHAHKVIHRDIKPDNIMIRNNRCVLIDFGAARKAGTLATKIAHPEYAPPEYGQGGDNVAVAAWDIYSIAVVSYEMLFGKVVDRETMQRKLAASRVRYMQALALGLEHNADNRPPDIVNWVCRMVSPDQLRGDKPLEQTDRSTCNKKRHRNSTPVKVSARRGRRSTATLATLRDKVIRDFDLPHGRSRSSRPPASKSHFNLM